MEFIYKVRFWLSIRITNYTELSQINQILHVSKINQLIRSCKNCMHALVRYSECYKLRFILIIITINMLRD